MPEAFAPSAGLYCWGGPGTVRMIRLKFFRPRIDEASLLRSYDLAVLRGLGEALGLSDVWATYSWGFSDATEAEGREFLRRRIGNFRAAGLRVHAYVQGTNLVTGEFRGRDLFCRDHHGRPIPYHRGRRLCCPLNPEFRALLISRVEGACREDVDGVYVDNFHFGQFPLPLGPLITFFGCRCAYCERAFRAASGHRIPHLHRFGDPATAAYVAFRARVMEALVAELAAVAHGRGKRFGTNSFDLHLDPVLFYGVDPRALLRHQDYLLVENFNHPAAGRGNEGLLPLVRNPEGKPVFVVSYRHVIGRHEALRQRDIDAVWSESKALGYVPCYKGSEFTTRGAWHNLDPASIARPRVHALPPRTSPLSARHPTVAPFLWRFTGVINAMHVPFVEAVYESALMRRCFGWVVDAAMRRRMTAAHAWFARPASA